MRRETQDGASTFDSPSIHISSASGTGHTSTLPEHENEQLIVAVPVVVRGPRLRQLLEMLPIDHMEVQLLARQFFARCDLRDSYMTLEKMAESFGISVTIAKGVIRYVSFSVLSPLICIQYKI